MKKTRKVRRSFVIVFTVMCMLISTTIFNVSASTATKTSATSNGYRVSSTASFSGKTVTGTGRVISGGPCSIKVTVQGYYKINGRVYSCKISDKVGNTQKLTKKITGQSTITKAVCTSVFNSETTITTTAS